MSAELDLGGGNAFRFIVDNPDAEPSERKRIGAFWKHSAPNGSGCVGSVYWEAHNVTWKLESPAADEHITLSPSLHCLTCGAHGFVRDGKWVPV